MHTLRPLDICALERFLGYVSPCLMDLFTPKIRCRCLNNYRSYGTVATIMIDHEPLGSIICGRSKPEIAERSQVISPQMVHPSGSIISTATVATVHRLSFKHYSQSFEVNCPIKHSLSQPKNGSSARMFTGPRLLPLRYSRDQESHARYCL
jgi:hypothetical protein